MSQARTKSSGGKTGNSGASASGKAVDKGTTGVQGHSGTRMGNAVAGSKGSGGAAKAPPQGRHTNSRHPSGSDTYNSKTN